MTVHKYISRIRQSHTFNGPLSGTTRVSRYQKGKTNLDFTEARDSKWQWHQLGQNHASARHSVFTGRVSFQTPNQQRQSTGNQCSSNIPILYSYVTLTETITIALLL